MSKTQAADYIGVCRATFDNYVREGKLPPGEHTIGFKEKSWSVYDLNKFKEKYWNT
jgi:predicted site-specific integrase-resolvase